MPVKVIPRYGIDPVQEVPAFSFGAEVDRLLETLSPTRRTRADIIEQVERIARTYYWRRCQNSAKPSRAEQNAALAELGQCARDLTLKLRGLDYDTEWELLTSFPVYRTSTFAELTGSLAERLEDLSWAAERALKDGKKQSGPRGPIHVYRAVVDLANLYRDVTGRPFTHTPRRRTAYDGVPHSPAGRFILEFFSIVDSSVSSTSLSTAMARAVSSRPQLGNRGGN